VLSYRISRNIIAGVGIFIIGAGITVSLRVYAQSGRVPFSAVKLVRVLTPSGVLQEQDTVIIAVKSDGSYARKSVKILPNKLQGSKEIITREIRDPSTQQQIALDVLTNSKQTFPINGPYLQSMTQPVDPTCAANLPRDTSIDRSPQPATVLGYAVVKLTTVATQGMMEITVERWIAPALNCEDLKSVATGIVTSKGLKAVTTVETLSITPGEPNSTLFDVPKDAVERTPTEMLLEIAKKTNDVCTMCADGSAAIFDKNYHSRRSGQ
jgi:hypothetical protein